jgi:hypothetical protein
MASWAAALPFARQWIVGGTLFVAEPSDRARHLRLHGETIVLLNGFIKKTQKTPAAEIDTALKRLKEMTS